MLISVSERERQGKVKPASITPRRFEAHVDVVFRCEGEKKTKAGSVHVSTSPRLTYSTDSSL